MWYRNICNIIIPFYTVYISHPDHLNKIKDVMTKQVSIKFSIRYGHFLISLKYSLFESIYHRQMCETDIAVENGAG